MAWRINYVPFFSSLSQGGELVEFVDRGKVLSARLSYENAQALAWKDSRGRFLLNPRLRRVSRSFDSPFRGECIDPWG